MKISILSTSALALLLALGLTSCRGGNASENVRAVENTAKAQGNKVIQDADYASPCAGAGIGNIGDLVFTKSQTVYHLSNLDFSKKQVYYTDGECVTPAFVVSSKGTINVRGPSTVVPEALDQDFTFEATTVTINSESLVKVFNTLQICGIKDWAVGAEKNVTPEAASKTCPGKATPRTAYEIAALENGNLVLGNDTSSEVEAERPKQLDRNRIYVRR